MCYMNIFNVPLSLYPLSRKYSEFPHEKQFSLPRLEADTTIHVRCLGQIYCACTLYSASALVVKGSVFMRRFILLVEYCCKNYINHLFLSAQQSALKFKGTLQQTALKFKGTAQQTALKFKGTAQQTALRFKGTVSLDYEG